MTHRPGPALTEVFNDYLGSPAVEATYYGPGFQISDMQGYLHAYLVNAHTMIDENPTRWFQGTEAPAQ